MHLETYKNQNTRNSQNSKRNCPYCRENGGYLLLKRYDTTELYS